MSQVCFQLCKLEFILTNNEIALTYSICVMVFIRKEPDFLKVKKKIMKLLIKIEEKFIYKRFFLCLSH